LFSRLGQKHSFTWGPFAAFLLNGTTVSHGRFHDNRRMDTSSDDSHFKISPFSCEILNSAEADARGVDGNLHFQVPSMNRLYQTEPTTFSILLCWTFFKDSVFLFFFECGNVCENMISWI
jgi:hypothetical protein